MKKFLALLFAILIARTVGYYSVGKSALNNREMPKIALQDGNELYLQSASYKADFLPKFINRSTRDKLNLFSQNVQYDSAQLPNIEAENGKIDISSEYDMAVKITDSEGNEVYNGNGENIEFSLPGTYLLTAETEIPVGNDVYGSFTYTANVMASAEHKIDISNITPVQGELVQITLENVYKNEQIEVDSPVFLTSAIYRDYENHSATFYIPITYYKPVGEYPFSITIGEDKEEYQFDVQKYTFHTTSFTVDASTSAATVESRRANQEYREKIHPLYNTQIDNIIWQGSMIKPVQETRISSQFGEERYINGSTVPERHSGIDYAAPLGTPVYAPADGIIEFSGFLKLSGNTIVLEHGLGLKSYFFHMNEVACRAGDEVKQGDLIGYVGTTGYSTGPHLHFQVSIHNQPVNPELLYK